MLGSSVRLFKHSLLAHELVICYVFLSLLIKPELRVTPLWMRVCLCFKTGTSQGRWEIIRANIYSRGDYVSLRRILSVHLNTLLSNSPVTPCGP